MVPLHYRNPRQKPGVFWSSCTRLTTGDRRCPDTPAARLMTPFVCRRQRCMGSPLYFLCHVYKKLNHVKTTSYLHIIIISNVKIICDT